ncbi:HalOD1 output domain-containing protein [Natrinema sp. 74]|uniref:HalOD1 output domain-containing protein n=1 Tax=Natrinema sp. 74 TaxID=3384159 RepID=UPI0038D42C06
MDKDPLELEPLHTSVDTGALDELVRVRDTTDGDISVTFIVEEYAITVYSYGVVAIDPPRNDRTNNPNEGAPHK